jgi:plastocyanin
MSRCPAVLAFTFSIGLAACGDEPGTSPTPPNPNVITINGSGVATPRELTVSPGTRVLFTNSHNRAHNMTSDPHPAHDDCPELNSVGVLTAGQSRESGNLNAVRTCGFHDHDEPGNASLQGRIIIR